MRQFPVSSDDLVAKAGTWRSLVSKLGAVFECDFVKVVTGRSLILRAKKQIELLAVQGKAIKDRK